MKRTAFWISILLALVAGLAFAGIASAQKPTPSDDQVNAVAHDLYCPVCENIPLDVCPTQACIQWRELIRQKLSDGWTKQQIDNYFAAQYGERVLAVPPLQRSFNRLLPILIGLGLLTGIALVVLALRNLLRTRPVAPSASHGGETASQDEYVRRIEEELKRRE